MVSFCIILKSLTISFVTKLSKLILVSTFGLIYTSSSFLQDTKKRTYPRKVRTVLQTLEKYLETIEESLKYTLSNGPIEGINNKIKNIKRSGYGYRSFRNLRNRALLVFSLVKKKSEPKELFYESSKEKKAS